MQYSRKASAIALALFLPLASSLAQTAPKEEPSKWALSLGVDPSALDLSTPDPGVEARVVGNLTRIWQAPGSRFSRQISLMVGTDAPHGYNSINSLFCTGCSSSISRSYAGLTAGGAVDLFRLSRFTPYIQGGAGIYYDRWRSHLSRPLPLSDESYKSNQFSFGMNAGLGIKARLGSHEFFVEQMLHTFQIAPVGRGVLPLNFGIRF